MIKSCYIHIPFCKKICSYCDFCKLIYNEKFVNEYLNSLEKEIEKNYQGEELDTIYIGGGTPSCLNIKELERLFKILNKLKKSKNIEYTIEGNFETTSKEKLLLYKKYNVNRLSLGVESINKDNLLLLDRVEDKDEIINKIKLMRELGFSNINLDLIYALPNETMQVLNKDLEFIINLDVEHISTYSLIIEDNTKLKINNIKNIDSDIDYKMYKTIINKLKLNGYNHYEISNFSKNGKESIHNNCYWLNHEYYGFGLGASSYIKNRRISNTRSITKYLKNEYLGEVEVLTKEDVVEYQIILNLRLIKGLDLMHFKEIYQKELLELYDYKPLVDNKLLEIKDNFLRIPEEKLYVSNEIIVKLIQNKKEL